MAGARASDAVALWDAANTRANMSGRWVPLNTTRGCEGDACGEATHGGRHG
jgi:hypothetical protein